MTNVLYDIGGIHYFIFIAIFIGYSIGSAPIISYHYGAQNHTELQSLFRKSLFLIGICSVVMFISGITLSRPLSTIFVGYDSILLDMTSRGMTIFSVSFIFTGLNIFASAFFTALNDGLTSALISFLRTVVFEVATVLLLPLWLGLDGIWVSVVVAEAVAVAFTLMFFKLRQKKFQY